MIKQDNILINYNNINSLFIFQKEKYLTFLFKIEKNNTNTYYYYLLNIKIV